MVAQPNGGDLLVHTSTPIPVLDRGRRRIGSLEELNGLTEARDRRGHALPQQPQCRATAAAAVAHGYGGMVAAGVAQDEPVPVQRARQLRVGQRTVDADRPPGVSGGSARRRRQHFLALDLAACARVLLLLLLLLLPHARLGVR